MTECWPARSLPPSWWRASPCCPRQPGTWRPAPPGPGWRSSRRPGEWNVSFTSGERQADLYRVYLATGDEFSEIIQDVAIQLGIFPVLEINILLFSDLRPELGWLTLSPPRRLYLRQFQRVLSPAATMLVIRPYLELGQWRAQRGNQLFTLQIPGAGPVQRQFCLSLLPARDRNPQPVIRRCSPQHQI